MYKDKGNSKADTAIEMWSIKPSYILGDNIWGGKASSLARSLFFPDNSENCQVSRFWLDPRATLEIIILHLVGIEPGRLIWQARALTTMVIKCICAEYCFLKDIRVFPSDKKLHIILFSVFFDLSLRLWSIRGCSGWLWHKLALHSFNSTDLYIWKAEWKVKLNEIWNTIKCVKWNDPGEWGRTTPPWSWAIDQKSRFLRYYR